ncbi:MAG: lipocalin-like domain-containing protein [Planctomycetota bacterium]
MSRWVCFVLILAVSLARAQSGLTNEDGYLLADEPRAWDFPRDFGRHDGFSIEWWYLTGNVAAEDGREFGFQITFFRSELTPRVGERPDASGWRTDELYFAHAAISDLGGETFWHDERSSRGHPRLASASDETMDVRLLDWSLRLEGDTLVMRAGGGDHAIDLRARMTREPMLQGPGGLNSKGGDVGQASYYYSLTRLETSGTLTIGGEAVRVRGSAWMDQEFSSNQLADNQRGWDWFCIQLADGRDVMAYQLRTDDGSEAYRFASVRDPGGTVRYLSPEQIAFRPGSAWRSPDTGAAYPQSWTIEIEGLPGLNVRSRMVGQELTGGSASDIAYFEGATEILDPEGRRIGVGYVEMTGYDRSIADEF